MSTRWRSTLRSGLWLAWAAAVATSARAADEDVATDARLRAWVEHALDGDPRVRGSNIDVGVVAGMVTLDGEAATLAARDYAALEALKIRGVLGVVNELEVKARFRTPAEVTEELRRALRSDELLAAATVGVDDVGGALTLQGVVPTETASEEAELLARSTPGVSSVVNDLRVVPPEALADADLAAAARAVLERDVYLTGLPIDASVRAGVLTLGGEVRTLYQKERAGLLPSWIGPLRAVVNEIVVTPGPDDGTRSRKPQLTDDEIATYVRAQLRRDARVDDSRIDVRVFAGGVSLSGSVPDPQQRHIASEDARNTVGVERVTDELAVGGEAW